MHRLKMYLDTSAISLFFQAEAGERQIITRDFFANIVEPRLHDIFISTVVLQEIEKTSDEERRSAMFGLVARLELNVLKFEPQAPILRLAERYAELRVIPPSKREDALHVAIATIKELDIIVTWNFRHLAGLDREARIASVNAAEGFTKPLRLITPLELAYP